MVAVAFDAESGTNGTTLTTGNSGFSAISTAGGGAIFSTAAAAHGSLGYRFTESASHSNARIDTFQGAASRIRCAFAIRISAAPSGALQVSYWTDSTNAVLLPRIIINTNRTLGVQNAGSSTLFTGATALALNTWYRVELVWIPGATTTTGTIGFGYAQLEDPIDSGGSNYFYATNVNTGTADGVGRWTLPKLSGTWSATVDIDDVRADDSTFTSDPATWLGTTTQNLTASGTLSGSGTLTAQPAGMAQSRSASLSGTGTLTGQPSMAVARAAALSGSGTLSGQPVPRWTMPAALSGSGTLTAGMVPRWTMPAALSGAGTLSAQVFGYVTPQLTGSGTLTAVPRPSWVKTAALSGTGTLVALTAPAWAKTAALSGSGTLAAAIKPAWVKAAAFSGTGTLTAVAIARYRFGLFTGSVYLPLTPKVFLNGVWRTDIPVDIYPANA